MQIKYLINDSVEHYIMFTLDLVAKKIKGTYVKDGVPEITNTTDASSVLSVEPSKNPHIQIAKKGPVWDFHIIKYDGYGKEHRRSVGILTAAEDRATKVEVLNDLTTGITLKNFLTHQLEVYNSSLAIAEFPFTHLAGVTGVSSVINPTPLLSSGGNLEMGYEGNIALELLGEASVNVNVLPFMLTMKINKLAKNDISGQHQLEMQLGDNRFIFSSDDGISLFSPLSLDPELIMTADLLNSLPSPLSIRLIVKPSGSSISIAGQTKELTNYTVNSLIDRIRLYSFCNLGEYSQIDYVYVHAMENFRADSIPPAPVTEIRLKNVGDVVHIDWKANTEDDLAGYRVYINNQVRSLGLVKATEYDALGLPKGVPARITVTAVDTSGNESLSSNVREIVPT